MVALVFKMKKIFTTQNKFLTITLPLVLWTALMIAVSSTPGKKLPEIGLWNFDKFAHSVEYFIFSFLLFRYMYLGKSLSLVKTISDRIYVMYLGKVVESASSSDLFKSPKHPYTEALLLSIPTLNRNKKPAILSGEVPSPINLPSGCVFKSRCKYAKEECNKKHPEFSTIGDTQVACYFPLSS